MQKNEGARRPAFSLHFFSTSGMAMHNWMLGTTTTTFVVFLANDHEGLS